MKGLLIAFVAMMLMFSAVSVAEDEIKKMSEIDISEGIVVLEFMSTTCPPCKDQINELKKVYGQYGDEVRIISVNIARESAGIIADYKREMGADWEFAIDDNGTSFKYGLVFATPTTVILKDGERVYRHVGVTSSSDLIREIEKVL
ncbi:MAG: TlpA disulfide reductase family protein [Candidatus Thermoplasmatota archaeon]|nr:TlpA disulfide reductase family protein [Candidatus Thermoplasmatota archaeon]